MPEEKRRADAALRREGYAEYAKAVACVEQGGELLREALRRAGSALKLWSKIDIPDAQDRALCAEAEKLMEKIERDWEKDEKA